MNILKGGFSFLALSILMIAPASQAQTGYLQTNLVSDQSGVAINQDPQLVNPWGIASSGTSPFWVSDNGNGLSTLYNSSGIKQALVVTVPGGSGGTGNPTGVVFNGTTDFNVAGAGTPAHFIFATEDGTISGWNAGTSATIEVNNATAVYKGLALGSSSSGNTLYATNFNSSAIDVFNATYAPTTLAGSFLDPTLPSGFAPFNIQNLGGVLYVTYAVRDAMGHDDVAGPGNGIVDRFDLNGNFLGHLVSNGGMSLLNSPWGLAIAPAGFGTFANDLLVGNFGDGRINVYDPVTGAFIGTLKDPSGNPITIDGLWGLRVGNGGNGGDANTVYFSAGPNDESDGLFGSLAFVPEPGTIALLTIGALGLICLRRKI